MASRDHFLKSHAADFENIINFSQADDVLNSLEKNYYFNYENVLGISHLEGDILANLFRRQAAFERFLVPWINIRKDLSSAEVIDIGCGTGSSAAALARASHKVTAYEIDPGPTAVAQDRARYLGLENLAVHRVDPEETIDRITQAYPQGAEVVTLIAVLEHMTEAERLDFLPRIWQSLRPGGVLVVAELPNKLTYFDDHTAQMPFFHLLPTQTKIDYVDRSPRRDFVDALRGVADQPRELIDQALWRWGIGLSYHDFEVGFGVQDLREIILADGYEHSTIDWWPPNLEERLLVEYFCEKPIDKPLGFCRSVLNFIFVKPYEGMEKTPLIHDRKHISTIFKASGFPDSAYGHMFPETQKKNLNYLTGQ